MEKNLSQLFKEGKAVELPAELAERIFARIDEKARVSERNQLYFWGGFFVFSLAAFIGSAIYAFKAFSESNFGSYFSLIFSDGRTVVLWWRELGLSLVESLPIFGVVLFLSSISLLLWSLRKFSKHTGQHNNGMLSAHTRTA